MGEDVDDVNKMRHKVQILEVNKLEMHYSSTSNGQHFVCYLSNYSVIHQFEL